MESMDRRMRPDKVPVNTNPLPYSCCREPWVNIMMDLKVEPSLWSDKSNKQTGGYHVDGEY